MTLVWLSVAVLLARTAALRVPDNGGDDLGRLDHRLPRAVVPERYELYLVPFHPHPSKFSGNVTISATVAEATDSITLHASYLEISRAVVRTASAPVREVAVKKFESPDDSRQFCVLQLDETLLQGVRYEIVFEFVGEMSDGIFGFYKRAYFYLNESRMLAATQFEATFARSCFPCFDEPSFKATFQINVARHSNLIALSNMPVMATSSPDPELDHRVWDRFQESSKMSTYLVAIVVGELESRPTADPRLTVWARRGVADQAGYCLSISPSVFKVLEDYTGVPYALPKLDQVALPGYIIAMENWGLVTYMESTLMHSSKWGTASAKQYTATVITHELAHQWFGNLVTADWWRYTWLNEGLAQFFTYHALDKVETSWRLMDHFVVSEMQPMMKNDAKASIAALDDDCSTPSEISHKFVLVTYIKGASLARMMQHVLTEETFRKGIHSYISSRQFATAEPSHLYAAMQTHAAADGRLRGVHGTVEELFGTWASQAGYPAIKVVRRYQHGSATVSQSRFFLKDSEVSHERWSVPLSWTSQSNAPAGFAATTPSAWILDNQTSIQLQNLASIHDWVIFNNQQAGYYRVNYDDENWRRIAAHLSSDSYQDVHVLNRAQVLDDSLNLARAGQLSYEVALDVTRFLAREKDYVPWSSAFNAFSFVDRMLVGSEAHKPFRDYLTSLLRPFYDSLGLEEDGNDPHFTSVSRMNAAWWACALGHAGCVQSAISMFSSWQRSAQPESKIHPNLKRVVYCTAIANGGDKEWDFLLSRYISGQVPSDVTFIVEALGCSKNPSTLKKYLQMSVTQNSGIGRQHASNVFSAVYNNHHGIETCLDFLVQNFKEMTETYGGTDAMHSSVTGIASKLTTQQQIQKLEDSLRFNNFSVTSKTVTPQTVIAPAKENMEWIKRYYHTIEKWLADNKANDVDDSSGFNNSFLAWIYYLILIFIQI